MGLGLAALLIGAGIPILEVNATHVFNPAWPAHARLHEVWQLITHSLLMAYCLRSLSAQDDARRPAAIILMVSGGFCAAVALQETYGGSMRHTDGTELAWLGVNVAVLVMGAIMLFSLLVLIHARARR
ncbi:MAG: hypothetical protein JNM76_15150 [Betaproteobacteria bacterium]|nr:hypothetical protein [Betaproteobacteria bacterium]